MKKINRYLLLFRLFRPEIIKDFVTLLKQRDALAKFEDNLPDSIMPVASLKIAGSVVEMSFAWIKTPEGYDYWNSINNAWRWKVREKYKINVELDECIYKAFLGEEYN